MDYYLFRCDSDTYHALGFRPPTKERDLLQLRGQPVAGSWKPLAVKWELVERPGDFPSFAGHIPVLSDRALKALEPLLRDYVEVLPLDIDDEQFGRFHALHVLPVLDCLDPARAKVERFEDGMIIDISHYAFREDVIDGAPVFRIQGNEFSNCYVSGDFRKAVERAKLKGLVFKALP